MFYFLPKNSTENIEPLLYINKFDERIALRLDSMTFIRLRYSQHFNDGFHINKSS